MFLRPHSPTTFIDLIVGGGEEEEEKKKVEAHVWERTGVDADSKRLASFDLILFCFLVLNET